MAEPEKKPQEVTVVPDGKITFAAKQWFHGAKESVKKPHYYPPRPHSEVDPLVCGTEILPAVYKALVSARKTIEISLWCFDPSLHLLGYDPDLKYIWDLYGSLRNKMPSPRVGDVLLAAADRGIKIRLLVWTFGEIMTNPLTWEPLLEAIPDIVAENEDKIWDFSRSRTTLTQKAILGLGLSMAQKQALLAFIYRRINFFSERPDENSKGYFIKKRLVLGDWVYQKLWYQKIRTHENIEYRTIGTTVSNDLIATFLADLAEKSDGLRQAGTRASDDFLIQAVLKNFPSHHQKTILVDYEDPYPAVGFVMGNNLRTVDTDHMSHPAKPPERGGRYPGSVPRQDIAAQIQGRALHDVNANFCRVWQDAGGSLNRPQPPEFLSTMKESFDEEEKEVQRFNGEAQVSCTIMRSEEPCFIHDAYMQAATACTQYVYVENQYFRYAPFAKTLKEYANRRYSESEQEEKESIYYFVVVNNPESISTGTTYEMLEELGHKGQMSGEEYRRQQQELERKREQLKNLKRNLANMESGAGNLSMDYFTIVAFLKDEIGKLEQEIQKREEQLDSRSKPLPAEKYESAEKAFRVEDSAGLKGHIATMIVSYEDYAMVLGSRSGAAAKKCYYVPVNIHTKTMIVDDVFTIIGSGNMHKRGMVSDNEIDVSTTRPGAAENLRKKLFDNLLGESFQGTWQEVYDIWKLRLDDNWRLKNQNKILKGFLFYLYEHKDQSNVPTVD